MKPATKRLALRLSVIALVTYFAFGALLVFREAHFLYLPYDGPSDPIAAAAPDFTRHELARDGAETVVYWENAPSTPRALNGPTILYLHGNGGGLFLHAPYINALSAQGFHVVATEYPSYPSAPGKPSQPSLTANAAALYDAVTAREKASGKPLPVIWGFSLGSGVASQLAAIRPSSALILEAPFTAVVDRAAEIFPLYPIHRLMRDQYRSRDVIATINTPLWIMHGDADLIIPVSHGRALFAAAKEPKTLRIYPGFAHLNLIDSPAYGEAIHFIDSLPR